MTAEVHDVLTWLYTTLAADAGVTALVGTRIYSEPAPEGVTFPMVVYQYQQGQDHPVFGTGVRTGEGYYIVRGVDKSRSKATVAQVADAIDAALEKAGGSVAGATILGSVRNTPFELTEVDQGVVYQHMGGTYRIWVQEA